jgi:Fe-S-cluster containining protein
MLILNFMETLYRDVDDRIGQIQGTCRNCRRCCDFDLSGLNLFVTNLELDYFLFHVKTIPPIVANRCPFLDPDRGCTVRSFRPLGCRTYFCEPPVGYDQQLLYEDALKKIKCFIRENDLSYAYVEWLSALRSKGV